MTLVNNKFYPGFNYRIETPDGTAIIQIAYAPADMSKIEHIEMNIGKAGSSVAAWANGFARVNLLALQQGVPLDVLIAELTDIATDRVVYRDGITCRSGPEALAIALLNYRTRIPKEMDDKNDPSI